MTLSDENRFDSHGTSALFFYGLIVYAAYFSGGLQPQMDADGHGLARMGRPGDWHNK